MSSARKELLAGIRAELPVVVGAIPLAIIYGVLAINAGLSPLLAVATSSILFAGSAQFIGTQLITVDTPLFVFWLTVFVINIRHLLYSAALAPHTRHLSASWRWLLAYLLTDEAFVVTAVEYEGRAIGDKHKHWFWFGAGMVLWTNWQLWTIVGVFFGTRIPESWSLDFAMTLSFIGMVLPLLKNRPMLAAALSAGVTAVFANGLPYRLSLMLAALVGIAVGVLLESRQARLEATT